MNCISVNKRLVCTDNTLYLYWFYGDYCIELNQLTNVIMINKITMEEHFMI